MAKKKTTQKLYLRVYPNDDENGFSSLDDLGEANAMAIYTDKFEALKNIEDSDAYLVEVNIVSIKKNYTQLLDVNLK